MIRSILEIHGHKVDWTAIGQRVQEIRLKKNLNYVTAAAEIGYAEGSLEQLESGQKLTRKCVNIIFRISQAWNLSLNWLLNGVGKHDDADPIELIPETLIIQKGPGIRKSSLKISADEGSFTDDAMEFVMAVDKYRKINDIPFPSTTQILEILLALGYRKSVPARIAPLGYDVEQQKKSEQANQESEPEDNNSTRMFLFIDPSGTEYITKDIISFCNEKNLSTASMYELASRPDTRLNLGWKVRFV